jgi:hypothetical protein
MAIPQTCLEFGISEGQTLCDSNCNKFKCQNGILVYVGRCGVAEQQTCNSLGANCPSGSPNGFQCCDGSELMQCVVPTSGCNSPYWTGVGSCSAPTSCPPNDGCPTTGDGYDCCGLSYHQWHCNSGSWQDLGKTTLCNPITDNLCHDLTRAQVLFESSPGGVTVSITGVETATVTTSAGTYGEVYKCLKAGSYTLTFSKSGYETMVKSFYISNQDIYSTYPTEAYASLVPTSTKCPAYLTCPESDFYTNCCDYGDVYQCNPDKTWHYQASGGCGCAVGNNLCPSGSTCNQSNGTCVPNTQTCPVCPSGQHCSNAATNYQCVPNAVTPCNPAGAFRCLNGVSQRCDGSAGWVPVQTCTGTCDTSTGKCSTLPGCTPAGGFRCTGNISEMCNGTTWVLSESCAGTCNTATGKCSSVLSCPSSCPSGQHCSGALTNYVCVDNTTTTSSVCTNGTTRCNPTNANQAQVCIGGAWSTTSCQNGCNVTTHACNPSGTSGNISTCSGMNRNGVFDISCIMEDQNKTLLYGAIGIAAVVLLMRR